MPLLMEPPPKDFGSNEICQVCERYANDYLNNRDVIAFLTLNEKIPKEIGKYLH